MNMLYESYDSEDDGYAATTAERRTRRDKPVAKRTASNYSRSHNRPAVFNGIHRRRHKKFTW